ncbi:unnamed protein product [Caenorhabditis bovis]|uniref:Oxidoreductase-like domain-containing protein n=1 Tax=Caenorhabditis bovis TaxID=2654633 RepID=A0A8S1F7Y8_9PELO|nr:unnamed protein product [Caenorhabditis bovis]
MTINFRRLLAQGLPPPMEPEPGLCCGDQCESCVWLVYANELIVYYRCKYPSDLNSLKRVKEELYEKIERPEIKAYVLTELDIAAKQMEDLRLMSKKKKKT